MKRALILTAMTVCLFAGSAAADPRNELVGAFEKALQDGSYRLDIQNSSGPDTLLEVQLLDRFHKKDANSEMIIVPGGTWISAAGRWMKVPVDGSAVTQAYTRQAMEQGINALQDVQFVDEVEMAGCQSRHYRYAVRGVFMGIRANSDAEAWICTDTGLPTRVIATSKGKTTTINYDFDAPINIQAPN
ncbi:MAG: hypothetical protein KDI75_08745 [Xanthomonadales bacterium]|nr:hypothetical protein [Xanthomonadales bacterium]